MLVAGINCGSSQHVSTAVENKIIIPFNYNSFRRCAALACNKTPTDTAKHEGALGELATHSLALELVRNSSLSFKQLNRKEVELLSFITEQQPLKVHSCIIYLFIYYI